MTLLTLILSLSTYFTGLGLDRGVDPRLLTMRLALIFLLPGIFWVTYSWVNKKDLGKL